MDRIRITELLDKKNKRLVREGNREYSRLELAEVLMPDGEEDSPGSIARKRSLVSEWDNGNQLQRFRISHLKRMATFFGTNKVPDLIQFSDGKEASI